MTLEWYGYWKVDPNEERLRQVARSQQGKAQPEQAKEEVQGQSDLETKRSRRNPQANDWPETGGDETEDPKPKGRG